MSTPRVSSRCSKVSEDDFIQDQWKHFSSSGKPRNASTWTRRDQVGQLAFCPKPAPVLYVPWASSRPHVYLTSKPHMAACPTIRQSRDQLARWAIILAEESSGQIDTEAKTCGFKVIGRRRRGRGHQLAKQTSR